MARIQSSRTGRRVRPETVGASDFKKALSEWSHTKELNPPPKFGDLRKKKVRD